MGVSGVEKKSCRKDRMLFLRRPFKPNLTSGRLNSIEDVRQSGETSRTISAACNMCTELRGLAQKASLHVVVSALKISTV